MLVKPCQFHTYLQHISELLFNFWYNAITTVWNYYFHQTERSGEQKGCLPTGDARRFSIFITLTQANPFELRKLQK